MRTTLCLDPTSVERHIENYYYLMLGLQSIPEGLDTDLRPKYGQTRGYLGVGRQGRILLLCYSPECHRLLLNIRNNSGLLAIEIDKLHDRLQLSKMVVEYVNFTFRVTQLAAGSSFGHKFLQIGRNSLDGLVCHSARS